MRKKKTEARIVARLSRDMILSVIIQLRPRKEFRLQPLCGG